MPTYVVYDKRSGAIVHVHKTADHRIKKEPEILGLVHPNHKGRELEVIEAEASDFKRGGTYRIDPATRKPVAAVDGAHSAAGAVPVRRTSS